MKIDEKTIGFDCIIAKIKHMQFTRSPSILGEEEKQLKQ